MTWFFIIAALLLVCLILIYLKTSADRTLEKMDIDVLPGAVPLLGHAFYIFKYGVAQSQMVLYNMSKNKKMYGVYNFRQPYVYVRDPEMIKNICIKNFNSFVDRPPTPGIIEPFHENLLNLKGDHWKRVRQTVSPTFSTSRVKRMSQLVEKCAKQMMENLREAQERNEDTELKDFLSCFTLDVIAAAGYSLEMNTKKNPTHPTAVQANKAFNFNTVPLLVTTLFPWLSPVLTKLNIHALNRDALLHFTNIVDRVLAEREEHGEVGKFNDFLDLLNLAEHGEGPAASKVLKRSEIHGVALNFLFAGRDSTSSSISSVLFMLAMHPECLKKVQTEIDEKIGDDSPSHDNVNQLTYLQMCINEAIRIIPVMLSVVRQCTDDVIVDGVQFIKGTRVFFPVYSMHYDPDLWPEPETFRPERFSPEKKDSINPYAFSHFGHGPRNCIGMRLATTVMKIALVSILQQFSPVPCSKTVYPPTLCGILLAPKDGLWVKMEARK